MTRAKESLRWHLDLHTAIRGSLHPQFGGITATRHSLGREISDVAGCGGAGGAGVPSGAWWYVYPFQRQTFWRAGLYAGTWQKRCPLGQNDLRQFAVTASAIAALLSGESVGIVRTPPLRYQVVFANYSPLAVLPKCIWQNDTLNFYARLRKEHCWRRTGRERFTVTHDVEYVLFLIRW